MHIFWKWPLVCWFAEEKKIINISRFYVFSEVPEAFCLKLDKHLRYQSMKFQFPVLFLLIVIHRKALSYIGCRGKTMINISRFYVFSEVPEAFSLKQLDWHLRYQSMNLQFPVLNLYQTTLSLMWQGIPMWNTCAASVYSIIAIWHVMLRRNIV